MTFSSVSNSILPKEADRSGDSQQSPGQTRDNPGQVSDHSTQVNSPLSNAEEVIGQKKRIKWSPMSDGKAWREFDEDISSMLENTLRGTSKIKLD